MKKKTTILAFAAFLGIAPLHAQTTEFLGETHAMERITTAQKFLLLPVEESQENSHVRVIQHNRVAKEFNIKLAANRVDYYVPLRLDDLAAGEALLDINVNFAGSTSPSGEVYKIRNLACWKLIKYADTFDTANREPWRPLFHHTPAWGWMNDPNGMFYKDGVWHLYFQHNPYGSQWENMTWGHSTSRDLIHWTFEGEAIEPDALGTIFSGSSVVDKNNTAGFGAGAVVAYYTSAGASQTQSMAYSLDNGHTFTKHAANPVLTSNIPDFRDPHVIWHEPTQRWIMMLSESQHMKIYSSANLKDWTHESDFGEGYGSHDGVWECPDLIEVKTGESGERRAEREMRDKQSKGKKGNVAKDGADTSLSSPASAKEQTNLSPLSSLPSPLNPKPQSKWILVCNINPGGPFGGSATQYFVGTFDGHKFTCDDAPGETKWMDWGKDHYATVCFDNAPDGRHVALPWMSNWQYANQVPTRQYRSANGIPRDLGIFEHEGEYYCKVTPSPEAMAAFAAKPAKRLTPACRVDVEQRGNATVTLSNDRGEQVVMTYDAKAGTFAMDRTRSGETAFSTDFAAVTTAPTRGKVRTLQLFIDRSSIEAFDAEGKMAMSNIVFPTEPYNKISVKGGKAKVYDMEPLP